MKIKLRIKSGIIFISVVLSVLVISGQWNIREMGTCNAKKCPVRNNTATYVIRQKEMMSYCQKKNITDTGVGNILVDDKRGFLYCYIHKIASTAIKRALIYSTGVTPDKKGGAPDINRADILDKYGFRLLSTYSKAEQKARINKYCKFIFVRHPLHRLLSAFRDRFEIEEQRKYFRLHFGREIIRRYRKNPSESSLAKANDVKFIEFAQYVVDEARSGHHLNSHWQTYQESCHPCHIKYDLIGHLETLEDDIAYLMDQINATHHTKPSTRDGPSSLKRTASTKDSLRSYYSTLPEKLIEQLYTLYEDDFLMFGYNKGL